MDKYIGIKLIEAVEMDNHTFAKEKYGEEKLGNENQPGYKVKYSDDYESWSPKNVFEQAYKKINGNATELNHDLITKENTYIMHDEKVFNSPHNYTIHAKDDTLLCGIHFQEGPVKENTLNGIFHEDLIAIVLDRLNNFQESEYSCRENAVAITKLEESLMWLRKRTLNRQKRGVQGTSEK